MGVVFPVFLTPDTKYGNQRAHPPTPQGSLPTPQGPGSPGPGVSQPCVQTPALPVASFTTSSSFLDSKARSGVGTPGPFPAWRVSVRIK